MSPQEPKKLDFRRAAALSSIGLLLPSSIAVGLFFGYYLDKLLHTAPWMLLVFFILGVISGFLSFFRALRKFKDDDNADADL
jgi:ATP synthase protein I